MKPRLAASLAVIAAVLSLPAAVRADTPAPPRHPVPNSALAAGLDAVLRPGSAPAGANDWTCRPVATAPRPVVLVHGLGASMTSNWHTISPALANAGFCVFALTYGVAPGTPFPLDQIGGLEPIERSAAELSAFVEHVLATTGAAEVDLVGHSEGTVVSRYYLQALDGAARVHRLVSLTPLYRGTDLLALASVRALGTSLAPPLLQLVEGVVGTLCGSCPQMLTGSPFLDDLNAKGFPAGVAYTNVVTRYDQLVVPFTSGLEDAEGVDNVVLQDRCVLDLGEHVAVAFDPVATRAVIDALDPAAAIPPVCTFVLPFVGSLLPSA